MQHISNAASVRVAFISGNLELGGATTFLCNLAGEFIRREVDCRVFSAEGRHPLAGDFKRRRIPVFVQDPRTRIFEDRIEAVLRELHNYRPNVVVATLGPFAFEILRYVPSGVHRIGMVQSDDPVVYATLKQYAACMDAVVGVSAVITDKLKKISAFRGIARHYLPYGVVMPERIARARAGESVRILYLGRIANEQKRVHLFPQILAALEKSGVPFHWTIAGDGPDRAELEPRLQCAKPRQRVEFAGAVAYSEISRLLDAHDIFLLASDFEGLPLSLLEAMGHGLVPVVSALESGVCEVVDATNGILVPVNDVAGYARGIVHLHKHRDELAAKSAAARSRVKEEFSVEAMTDRWLAAFPKTFPAIGEWPARWKIQPPLPARHPVYFSPPMRALRRMAARLRR